MPGRKKILLLLLLLLRTPLDGSRLLPAGEALFSSLPPGGSPFLTDSRNGLWLLTRDEGLFSVRPDLSFKKEFIPPAAVTLPPVRTGDDCLLFLEDGSIFSWSFSRKNAVLLAETGMRFLAAAYAGDGRVFFLSDEFILFVLHISDTRIQAFGYAPTPRADPFLLTDRHLLVRSGNNQAALFQIDTLRFLKHTNLSQPGNTDLFLSDGRSLFSRENPGSAWIRESVFAPPASENFSRAFFFTNSPFLFLSFPEGRIYSFHVSSSNRPQLSAGSGRSLPGGLELHCTPDGCRISSTQQPLPPLSLPWPGPPEEPCEEVLIEDLDGDGKADVALLFRANRTMSYTRIVFAFSESPPAEFSTIAARNFQEILRDLDGDGRKELILTKEMNINLDTRPDHRLLVPEVYRMRKKQGFLWASIRHPDFYEARKAESLKRAAQTPFPSPWKNRIWAEMNAIIIALQTELITLNRQIRQTSQRSRTEQNRAGLSLWYYKKGLEMFRNRWDNLALFAFQNALEQNPSNKHAAFQASRLYAEYGLFDRARLLLDRSRPEDIVFIQNQNYYKMKEDSFPVLFDPDLFYKSYHAGETLFHTGDYNRAAQAFARCLAAAESRHPSSFREKARMMLAECLLIMNRFKEAEELYKAITQTHPGAETEYKLRLARSLAAAVKKR